MTDLQKYEPMLEIELYDGGVISTPATNKENLKKAINQERFVEINGVIINTREIKKIQKANIFAEWTKTLPPDQLGIIRKRCKKYSESVGRNPTQEVINQWIQKLNKGEDIFKEGVYSNLQAI
jgi:hypothetical protein